MKSLKHVVLMLVALTLVLTLGACSKNTTPTGLDQTLDQTAPATPARIVAEIDASAGSATLDWTPSASANAAGYEIYQYVPSPQRENAYALVGETDAAVTSYALSWSSQQTTLYYRLRTVSSTGVKSPMSALITVTVGPTTGSDPEPGDGAVQKLRP